MNEMKRIVKECLDRYVGGNKYFHELDDRIKFNRDILYAMHLATEGTIRVLSGEFGRQFVQMLKDIDQLYDFILVEGSPRKNEDVRITKIDFTGGGNGVVFIDDTYFSGKTFFYCKGLVKGKYDIDIDHSLVAYDGSKHKRKDVRSFYRYFDHHDSNGQPI